MKDKQVIEYYRELLGLAKHCLRKRKGNLTLNEESLAVVLEMNEHFPVIPDFMMIKKPSSY